MKKAYTLKNPSQYSNRLDALIKALSESKKFDDDFSDNYMISIHLIEISDHIKSFCKLSNIQITYCGYMETCFKGRKESLGELIYHLPENKRDTPIREL